MPHNQQEEQESVVKKQGKKLLRDRALKLGKKVGKAAVKLLAKGALAIGKTIISFIAGIGLPYIAAILGAILIVFMIYLGTSFFFVSASDELDPEGTEFLQHIQRASDNTVDMSRPEQVMYKVPIELLISVGQIYDSDGSVSSEDAISKLANALRPIFEYEIHKGEIETKTTTCTDGSCSSSTSTQTFEEELLVRVDAWDRIMTAEVKKDKSEWEVVSTSSHEDDGGTVTSTTVSSRTDMLWTEETVIVDYTLFDKELSKKPFEYGEESKKSVEAIYELNDREIYYSEWLAGEIDGIGFSDGNFGFDGTVTPGGNIPVEYMGIYLAAEKKSNVPWYYLAAFHYVETKFSTHKPMISSVGAEGHFQFMPCTWIGWGFPGCKGSKGFVNVDDSVKHSTAIIKKYSGEGVDGDGDGKADPFNLTDAVFSAASYLNKQGFSKDKNKAIRAYNHSDKYVADINAKAQEFKDAATYVPNPDAVGGNSSGFIKPTSGRVSSGFGSRTVNGKASNHRGQDVANSTGTPIIAIADGVVRKTHNSCPKVGSYGSKCGGGWGNHVIVRHTVQGKVYDAVYAHFNAVSVTNGKVVKQGELLGLMGTSGSSTGTHLHFEIHPGGRTSNASAVNPVRFVSF